MSSAVWCKEPRRGGAQGTEIQACLDHHHPPKQHPAMGWGCMCCGVFCAMARKEFSCLVNDKAHSSSSTIQHQQATTRQKIHTAGWAVGRGVWGAAVVPRVLTLTHPLTVDSAIQRHPAPSSAIQRHPAPSNVIQRQRKDLDRLHHRPLALPY